MRRYWILFGLLVAFSGFLWGDETNDFYDNSAFKELGRPTLELAGEISSPGVVDLSALPLHRVIARESEFKNGQVSFRGAYRYEGYSLFDILNRHLPRKKSAQEFAPPLDLLLAIENKAGERVILSWGEVFYPAAENRIIIAVRASPVVPLVTKEQWPLPDHPRLVCGNDLITVRNLDNPSKITVFSAPVSFAKKKNDKLYSEQMMLCMSGKKIELLVTPDQEKRSFPSIFYGRGKGFHGYQIFSGYLFKSVLQQYVPSNPDVMKRGYWVVFGADGYRVALAYSELCNRNDQAEFLLIDEGRGREGGRYSMFAACDFFSDRAVKAIQEVHFLKFGD